MQWYGYVPGCRNVNEKRPPDSSGPESKDPSSAVIECGLFPWCVHVTAAPGETRTLSGRKLSSSVVTEVSPAPAWADASEGARLRARAMTAGTGECIGGTISELQVDAGSGVFPLRGDRVDLPLPDEQVLLSSDLDLDPGVGKEEHPVTLLHVADVRSDRNDFGPQPALAHRRRRRRDYQSAFRPPLAIFFRSLHQHAVGHHADGFHALGHIARLHWSDWSRRHRL